MLHPNSLKNIANQGFHTNPERINKKGRPKKLFSSMAADLRAQGYEPVTPSRLAEAYEMLLGLPEKKLKEIMADKEQPVMFKIMIKAMIGSRGPEVINTMLDRVHGKPKQHTQIDLSEAREKVAELFPWKEDEEKIDKSKS